MLSPTLSLPLAAAGELVEAQAATGAASWAWLLIAIPALSALVLLVLGRAADGWGHWLGVLASVGSFAVGLVILLQVLGLEAGQRVMDTTLFTWLDTGELTIDAGLRIDPLSLTFVMLVTFVGSLIHIYSVAYMEHDADRRRFFAYLNLFVAAMLTLVLGNSYLVLFFGWEGVGLASYLLIGFWNYRTDYAVAAKKAFVMNRVGDLGLLVGMMLLFAAFGAVDFQTVFAQAQGANEGLLTAVGLAFLLAACGKSAQFPLQAWLGDAMAGPTPVSALIHAATMVTAGVYLLVRSNPILTQAPTALLVIAIIGAITLIFGAVIGCAKDDIKKVLAASTMSQIGYMMLGAGLGPAGYAFAIFHLFTHGFFKAGMFLGAGSVMHGMNEQTDMRRFGGLSKYMKITWITFGLGWLAILGIFPFSGFWSKDKIIESAFSAGGAQGWVFGIVALVGAGITAFYMSRLFFMTFHGDKRWTTESEGGAQHPHESPALMWVPMVILAIGSLALGGLLSINDNFVTWLVPSVGETAHHEPPLSVMTLIVLTHVVVIAGVAIAWFMTVKQDVAKIAPHSNALVRAARNDLYQDAFNETVFMRPGAGLSLASAGADRRLVDGAVMGLAGSVAGAGALVRKLQTGYVRSYAATMLLGIVIVLIIVLASRA